MSRVLTKRGLTLSKKKKKKKIRLFQIGKSLQTTISSLTKMVESSPKGQKTLLEMEKLLVTSNFLLFSQCFQKTCTADTSKPWFVLERVNSPTLHYSKPLSKTNYR